MSSKKIAVIGYPIKHSLSPTIHNYWLSKYNIDATYKALEIPPEGLEKFITNLKSNNYLGCNVTVPHKVKTLQHVKADEFALAVGAINTIKVNENNSISGYNTDSYGFIENIKNVYPKFNYNKAVILGAGGAARAVIVGLINEGCKNIYLINRTIEKAQSLASSFTSENIKIIDWSQRSSALDDTDILINTTTLGMLKQPPLDIDLKLLPPSALVNDIVYNPLETDLLYNACIKGNKTIDGLGMLLYQAQKSFEIWFNIKPKVTKTLRNLIVQQL